uniref:dnaJ homolog subfamily A member 3, mitochondrial isoform X1 n=1 Tax=Ciona intestinalis TaxID=7719 RepID=UPI0005212B7F|nr:dnaJ homolog subfamily A member 3, mitochondrial isoform X1 [Ciona intestinalis]|eukprot:XP_026693393.1 dnaJ homolog subfamily A member 3, mitochondrial isoform X1 [Ciona intestinalis]
MFLVICKMAALTSRRTFFSFSRNLFKFNETKRLHSSLCCKYLKNCTNKRHLNREKYLLNTSGISELGCHGFHLSSSYFASKDFYKILGVSKNASQKDIKKSYYQLAKKFHPDTNKGDKNASVKFAEVAEAYEVLGDETKRQQYDMLGSAGFQANQQGGRSWGASHGFQGQMDPEDLFRKIFEEFSGGGGQSRGFDNFQDYTPMEVYLDLTFNEAAKGANKTMKIDIMDTCPRCDGKGNEPGTKISKCGFCGGSGMEQVVTGPFVMRSTCRKCGGTGKLVTFPCVQCGGRGQVKQKKSVTVPVPAGVEDKQTVRMQVGTREVFITFKVAPSKVFRRQGADVHSDVEISIAQAALGGSIRVPGIHTDTELEISPGTSSHERFHFRGKGIKKVNSYGFGDHYVHVKIKPPKTLTPKQKSLLIEFAQEDGNIDGTVEGVYPVEKKVETEDAKTEPELNKIEEKPGFFSKIKKAILG